MLPGLEGHGLGGFKPNTHCKHLRCLEKMANQHFDDKHEIFVFPSNYQLGKEVKCECDQLL